MRKKTSVFLGLLMCVFNVYAEDIQTQQRIFLLESALIPTTPQAAADMWAKAVKNRNGAVQYMLMCPPLQKTHRNNLIALNWVTGVSSPWVSNYKIISQGKNANTWQFDIQYQLGAGGGTAGINTDHIHIIQIKTQTYPSPSWCIDQFHYLSAVG